MMSVLIPILYSQDLIDSDFDMGMGPGETHHSTKNELHLASYRGDLEEVKVLVEEKGLNPLQKGGPNGVNALHYAAGGGQLAVLKYFVKERGCNPASQSNRGWTPLHYAARYNHFEVVQCLVDELQMDPMCQTELGSTPLHTACAGGADIAVVEYLVQAMSKYLPLEDVVRCKGKGGHAPVHTAALFGHLEIINLNSSSPS